MINTRLQTSLLIAIIIFLISCNKHYNSKKLQTVNQLEKVIESDVSHLNSLNMHNIHSVLKIASFNLSKIEDGNVISIQNIPDGTTVCNVEKQFGDGGSFMKSAGANATVFSHEDKGVTLKLPSGKFTTLNPKNRAMIGTLAGGGVGDRPLMRAGVAVRRFKAKGQKYPIVRGVAQGAYNHPHGGGRHQHVGQSSTVARDAPPGAKVGSIAARKTGRARIKERKK